MNRKFWLLPFLFLLIATTAQAAFTLTWNEPSSGAIFNNTPANRQTIDLNFTVVDNNAGVRDINIGLIFYQVNLLEKNGTTIVASTDWNGFASTNADMNCVGSAWTTPGKHCTYRWTMLLNSNMADDEYYIDANVISWGRDSGTPLGLYDANATRKIQILTKLSTAGATRALLSNIGIILAAAVLFTVLAVGVLFRPDMKTLIVLALSLSIAVAIGAMVIGTLANLL